MNRTARIASGIVLALLVVTCTDKDLNGPRYQGRVGLNFSAFRNPPASSGQPPIPIDSITVDLTSLDGSGPYDTAFAFGGLPYTNDSMIVALVVPLKHAKETFALHLTVKGQGSLWFVASDTVIIGSGRNTAPPITAVYVGPGHNTGLMLIGPQDSTVVPGLPVLLHASVSDSFEGPLTGVPVGFRLQNPALGAITYPTYLTPTLIPINAGTKIDTTWLIGETPNHVVDSTQIYIVPKTGGGAPALIYVAGGNAQVDTPKAVLPLPLQALVTDASGIPAALAKVAWTKTGQGSFVSPTDTTVADSFGFAKMTYQLGSGLGTDTITASIVGVFAGPPPSVSFTATADTGLALSFDTTAYMLGKGQITYLIGVNTRIPAPANLPVKISVADSASPAASQIVSVVDTPLVLPQGGTFACCFSIVAKNLGTTTVIGHAAGYRNATASVVVTTPALVVSSNLFAYSGLVSVFAYAEAADSTGTVHYTANDLVITDSSADSTILKPDSASITIPASTGIAVTSFTGVNPGLTSVTFRAPGYTPAVMQVQVDTSYVFVSTFGGTGLGLIDSLNYVSLPGVARVPLVVTLQSSNPGIFTVPATVTILPDSVEAVFPITGTGLGQATLTVHAAGFPVSDSIQTITVSTPLVQPVVAGTVARGVKTEVTVYAEDSIGYPPGTLTAPIAVHLSTTDPNAVWDSTTITMKAGTSLDSVGVVFNSTGTFTVTATATGYLTGTTSTSAAAPPIAVRSVAGAPRPIRVIRMYPDSLRKVRPSAKRPAPPRR